MAAVFDLFAGVGGLSLGAEKAGCDVLLAVEIDAVCCKTLAENQKRKRSKAATAIIEADITGLTGQGLRKAAGISRSEPLIIVGGAPCQPFSKAAYWTDPGDESRYRQARARGERIDRPTTAPPTRPDPRRSLVMEFWRIVIESNAQGFVFENVPSILHPRNRHELDTFIKSAEKSGFHTTLITANAAEFGVAQTRQRVFILGHRKAKPQPPKPTHTLEAEALNGYKPAVTAGEVLEPFLGPEYFEPEEVVIGKWAEHLKTIPPGWNYKAHTAWAGHPNPAFVTETRFWSFLLKLSPDRPSWTIAANPGPWVGPFHWQSRRLRTVEMAALQGFPKSYRFAGSRRERVRQIGNAVPAPLAAAMIRAVVDSGRKTVNAAARIAVKKRRPLRKAIK